MASKLRLTRSLILLGSLGVAGGSFASGCASGGEADTGGGTGNRGGSSGGDAAGGSSGTAGSSVGGVGGVGGSGGSSGSGAGTGGSGGSVAGSGGDGGGAGMAGGAGDGATGGGAGSAGAAGAGGGGGSGGANGEICNGLDDNGNGQIDEGNPGGGDPCTVPNKTGVCANGTTTCSAGLIQCIQDNQPSTEVCDGLDNNCNGTADEGNPGGNQACDTGLQGICQVGTTSCTGGTIICNQNLMAGTEVCNSLDDNCDGQADEGNPGGGVACMTGLLGECGPGTTDCQGGQLQCVQNTLAAPEVCDALDNDCDGNFDEDLNGLPCSTGNPGICDAGTTLCSPPGTAQCIQTAPPGGNPEQCNMLDDNCSGTADDDPAITMCARNCGQATIPDVVAMACNTGSCIITQCPAGKKNDNGDFCDGCEATSCTTNPSGTACGSPNTVGPANSPVTGQIVTVGGEAWFRIQFSPPAAGNNFNVQINLSQGAADYQMDVLGNNANGCAASALNCPIAGGTSGSGSGTDVGTWEMDYTYDANCLPPGRCTNNSTFPANIFVRITRTQITSDECDPFSITITQTP